MASSDKFVIEKLGTNNYASWKILMELYLTHKGLESTIEAETRTQAELDARSAEDVQKEKASQKKALALIGLRVEQEYLGVIKDSNGSAREAWLAFERMFQSVTNARKMMLRQRLATLKMEPGEKAAKYIARAKDLKRDLIQAELDAKEVDLAAACGLSKEYREIRMMLEYQEKPINLDEMLPILLQHEGRIEQEEEEDEERQSTMAFSSRGFKAGFKKDFQRKQSDSGGQGCYTCGQPGHRSFECERNPHRNMKCNKCGRKGHIKKDCRSKETEEKKSGNKGFQKTMAFSVFDSKGLAGGWFLDSGATHHLTGQKEKFLDLKPLEEDLRVQFGNEGLLRVEGIGTVELFCETKSGVCRILLEDVRYVPGAGVNLASLSKFLKRGASISGKGEVCELEMGGEVFLRAVTQSDLLVIQEEGKKISEAFAAREQDGPDLWHRRFCHAGFDTLARMAQEGLVEGLPVSAESFKQAKPTVCGPCVLGKQVRKPFPRSNRESSQPLELVHMDVCGPMQEKTPGGNRYFVSFTDDYSRCSVLTLLKEKKQVKGAMEAFVTRMETQLDRKVKSFQSDRGGEFWNRETEDFCGEKGIIHRKTNPYSPQEGGVAERLNRILMEKTRAMLADSGLGPEYWGEAVMTANYVRNRTVSSVHGKTPYEMFAGEKPKVDNLRVFGSKAFVHVPSQKRKKLDAVSEPGVFLGYEPNTKGYRILRNRDWSVIVSKDVTFAEERGSSPVVAEDSEEEDGESGIETEPESGTELQSEPQSEPQTESGTEPESGAEPEPESSASGGERDGERTRGKTGETETERVYPRRERKPNSLYPKSDWQQALSAKETAKGEPAKGRVEPQTYEEALSGEDAELWQRAMDEEMASLLENKTWRVELVPEGVKPVPVKWVFKIKTDENGNVERYKARVCAKGYKQKQGVDFEEVFAPVSRQPTVRALLSLAAVEDLEIEQLDVKTAFLNGELEEEIWMEQPQGFEVGGNEKACHLQKALYGLKQAPRAWHLKLTEEMGRIGFVPSTADPSLFVKQTETESTYAAVWVDDCLIVGKTEGVKAVKEAIGKVFTVRDLGPVRYFLGMEVTRDRTAKTIRLTQKRATSDLLEEFGMTSAKPRVIPMGVGEKATREGQPLDTEEFPYSKLVGSLLYLSNCTRPDIAQSVGVLSRFMSSPTVEHWRLAKGVLSYLAGTVGLGIEFGKGELQLGGFCDANHAGDIDTRRSTTGYVFILGGGAVSWASKLQPTVAFSTVEAEYMSAAFATKEALWLKKLCLDLGLKQAEVKIWCDNQGAVKLTKHPIASQRSKHIDVTHHFVRERVLRKEVTFEYCPTEVMAADFLTKAVAPNKFETCCNLIGLK